MQHCYLCWPDMPFNLKEAPARKSRLLEEGIPDFRDAAFPSFFSQMNG